MKDEIKEILDNLQRVADRKCYPEDILDGSIAKKWVDYITNLKEENESLKELNVCVGCNNNPDYKQRIDKAIEYIHNHQPVFELSNKEQIQEWFEKEYYIELLNILNGDDEE